MINHTSHKRHARKVRIRKKISGTKERPRLSIFRSSRYIYVQLIDDVSGKTLLGIHEKMLEKADKNKITRAFELGKYFAAEAQKHHITACVFDRSGFRYHGRVKSFADGVREGGLKI